MDSKKIIGVLTSTLFLITLGIGIPVILLFGKAGVSDPKIRADFILFQSLFITGILTSLISYFVYSFWKSNNKLGDAFGFYNKGEKPSSAFFKNFTHPQLFIISLILFIPLFLIGKISTGFSGGTSLRILPQQFSKTDSLIFATAQIPVSENIFILGILSLLFLLLSILFIKLKINKQDFKFYVYFVYIILGGAIAWILHQTVYSGSDIAGFVVFSFWAIGGLLTLWTGSPYPFLAVHISNNFIISASLLYSDFAVSMIIGAVVLLTIFYGFYYRNNLFGKKRAKEGL